MSQLTPCIENESQYRSAVKQLDQNTRPPLLLRLPMNAQESYRQARKIWIAAVCLMVVSVVVLSVTLAWVTIGLIDSYGVWVVVGAAVAGTLVACFTAAVAWALQEDYVRGL